MGTILSSNKDFNRALARQPRTSIGISKFEIPDNLQQHSFTGSLSIPAPVRNIQSDNGAPVIFDETSPSELNQPSVQYHTSPSSTDKQLALRNSLFPNNQIMNQDASIIYRSVMNLNHHRRLNNNQLSLSEPNRSIIERNGKQFLIEIKERMERRYVQVFDETIGEMRLFEVVDYIPCRIVRSIRTNSQNGISRNHVRSSVSSKQRSALAPITNNRTEPVASSNLVGFSGLSNRETVDREFDIYHRGDTLNPPPPADQHSNNATYPYSEPKISHNPPGEVPTQYAPVSYHSGPSSFRHHSPTASDYSASTSITRSMASGDDSDSEANDRTSPSNPRRADKNQINTDVSYGTVGGRNSPLQVNPFEKKISQRDPYYKKRQASHNYSEPVLKSRGFQPSTTSDYAPIPLTHKPPPNSSGYSYRRESDGYNA